VSTCYIQRYHNSSDVDFTADQPRTEEAVDADGIRTITHYTTNEDGKKVKES
jgi:hypothetical protein